MPVRRQDLRGFDSRSAELILWAQTQGARVRISNRGHAILFGPYGGTACVAPKSNTGNRSYMNARSAVNRLLKKGTD